MEMPERSESQTKTHTSIKVLWAKSYIKLHPTVSISGQNLDFNGITFSHKEVKFTHCFDFCSYFFHRFFIHLHTQYITQICSTAHHKTMV